MDTIRRLAEVVAEGNQGDGNAAMSVPEEDQDDENTPDVSDEEGDVAEDNEDRQMKRSLRQSTRMEFRDLEINMNGDSAEKRSYRAFSSIWIVAFR